MRERVDRKRRGDNRLRYRPTSHRQSLGFARRLVPRGILPHSQSTSSSTFLLRLSFGRLTSHTARPGLTNTMHRFSQKRNLDKTPTTRGTADGKEKAKMIAVLTLLRRSCQGALKRPVARQDAGAGSFEALSKFPKGLRAVFSRVCPKPDLRTYALRGAFRMRCGPFQRAGETALRNRFEACTRP